MRTNMINKDTIVYFCTGFLQPVVSTLQEYLNKYSEGTIKMDNESDCYEIGDDGYIAPISLEQAIDYVEHSSDISATTNKKEFFDGIKFVRDTGNCLEEEYDAFVADTNAQEYDCLYSATRENGFIYG